MANFLVMPQFPVNVAKTQLSALIGRALAGEEIVISRGASPVVRLVAIVPVATPRVPGALRGRLTVGDAFFEPLPEDELAAWGE